MIAAVALLIAAGGGVAAGWIARRLERLAMVGEGRGR